MRACPRRGAPSPEEGCAPARRFRPGQRDTMETAYAKGGGHDRMQIRAGEAPAEIGFARRPAARSPADRSQGDSEGAASECIDEYPAVRCLLPGVRPLASHR